MLVLFDASLFACNVVALGLMLKIGSLPERYAVALIVIYFGLEVLVAQVMIGDWRAGASFANLILFLGLWALSERWARWWLILASGFQLVVLMTHVLPFLTAANLINTGVILRKIGWSAISAVLFIAVWEAWADRRFRLERGATCDDETLRQDGELAPAATRE